MRRIYSLLLYLLIPVMLLRLLWRSLKAPDYRKRISERFGIVPPPLPTIGGVWIHAVSVGEVQASASLIQYLLQTHSTLPLIITTTTPTGSHRLRELFSTKVYHVYVPYDLPAAVKKFLDATNPILAVFVETEIWPNILHQCQCRKIPTVLVNARLSARSARGYARFANLARETLNCFDQIVAQSAADADRFIALGAASAKLIVTGNIKFDSCLPPNIYEQSIIIRRIWGLDRPVWIAASTHEGEDELILAAHKQVRIAIPNALLILVPRHPERFFRVGNLVLKQGMPLVRRSEARCCTTDTAVFLGDSMGELPMFFAAVDVAFIGGSLIPHGGHNLLEPAAVGVPVIVGPHMINFAHITELLLAAGAAKQITTVNELATVVVAWLSDNDIRSRIGENGRQAVKQNHGSLLRLIDVIEAKLVTAQVVLQTMRFLSP